jgi:hypothetical protein
VHYRAVPAARQDAEEVPDADQAVLDGVLRGTGRGPLLQDGVQRCRGRVATRGAADGDVVGTLALQVGTAAGAGDQHVAPLAALQLRRGTAPADLGGRAAPLRMTVEAVGQQQGLLGDLVVHLDVRGVPIAVGDDQARRREGEVPVGKPSVAALIAPPGPARKWMWLFWPGGVPRTPSLVSVGIVPAAKPCSGTASTRSGKRR